MEGLAFHCICKASCSVWKASPLGTPMRSAASDLMLRRQAGWESLITLPTCEGDLRNADSKVLQDWDPPLLKVFSPLCSFCVENCIELKPLPHTQYIGSRCTVNWKISFKTRLHIAWKLAVIWVHITALGAPPITFTYKTLAQNVPLQPSFNTKN